MCTHICTQSTGAFGTPASSELFFHGSQRISKTHVNFTFTRLHAKNGITISTHAQCAQLVTCDTQHWVPLPLLHTSCTDIFAIIPNLLTEDHFLVFLGLKAGGSLDKQAHLVPRTPSFSRVAVCQTTQHEMTWPVVMMEGQHASHP